MYIYYQTDVFNFCLNFRSPNSEEGVQSNMSSCTASFLLMHSYFPLKRCNCCHAIRKHLHLTPGKCSWVPLYRQVHNVKNTNYVDNMGEKLDILECCVSSSISFVSF